MRLDAATLSLERRTVGECIDLALVFYRTHFWRISLMTLLFAGPLTALVAYSATTSGGGWFLFLMTYFFGTPFLGALIVAATGHHVFGDPFSLKMALTHVARRLPTLVLLLPLSRVLVAILASLCVGMLWVPYVARYGFVSEVILLERLSGRAIARRLEDIQRGRFFEASGRVVSIVSFTLLTGISLFIAVDMLATLLFDFPIFFGKLSSAFSYSDWGTLFSYDPWVVGSFSLLWWFMYPIARLAWFFCYLDVRIRSEGWDIEIDYRIQAARLAHA